MSNLNKKQVAVTTCFAIYKKDFINLKILISILCGFFSNVIAIFLCF